MNIRRHSAGWTRTAALLILVVAISLPAWGQGCALCYTQAASSGTRMIQALRRGILVLIFPPVGICIGLTVMSYRKRNTFAERCQDVREPDRLGW